MPRSRYQGVKQRGTVWYCYYPYSDPTDGTRKQKWERATAWGFPNSAEGARDCRVLLMAQAQAGGSPAGGAITVPAWVEKHIASLRDTTVSTRRTYRAWARRRITPYFASTTLRELTRADVTAWHGTLLAAGISPTTVACAHTLLSGAMRVAVMDGFVPRNVVALARPPRRAEPETPYLDADELRRWLGAADTDETDGALFRLLATTGLRISEALALRWTDIDLAGRRLWVRRSKSAAGVREVGLVADDVAALRLHSDRQRFQRDKAGAQWLDEGYVFTRADGRRLAYDTVVRRIGRRCHALGITPLTPHGLRHTHGTYLASIGIPQRAIAERLGHASTRSTERYMHASTTMMRETVDRLEAALTTPAERLASTPLANSE